MRKHKIRVAAGVAGIAALIVLEIVLRPPLWYYTNFTLHPRVLPTRLIRPAIRFSTGHVAPAKVEDAQGIVHGGRDPAIFVRFRTDDHGLQYLLQEFGGPGAAVEVLDEEVFRSVPSGWFRFASVMGWQKQLGVRVYDPSSIRSAKVLMRQSPTGFDPTWYVLIDEEQHTVYILGIPHM